MGAAENRQIVADACAAFGQQDIGRPLAHCVQWMTLRDVKSATFDYFEHDTHDNWTQTDKSQVGQAN